MITGALLRSLRLWPVLVAVPVMATAVLAQDGGSQGGTPEAGLLPREVVPGEAVPGQQILLTLNEADFFGKSAWGQAAIREAEAAAAELSAENRAIETSLEEEERSLTEKRGKMPASEFSALATAFDTRVQEIRQTQDGKSRAINRKLDEDRKAFIEQAQPLLVELLDEYGAVAIIADDVLILSRSSADVTQRAIDLMNERLPAPAVAPEPPPEPAPDPVPDAAPEPAPAP